MRLFKADSVSFLVDHSIFVDYHMPNLNQKGDFFKPRLLRSLRYFLLTSSPAIAVLCAKTDVVSILTLNLRRDKVHI